MNYNMHVPCNMAGNADMHGEFMDIAMVTSVSICDCHCRTH